MLRKVQPRLFWDIGIKKTAAIVLMSMSVLATFLVILPFLVRASAPNISLGGWKDGQNNIVVVFDQPVTNGADAALDAADFTVAGANSISVSSVTHSPGSNVAIVTLSGPLNSAGGTDFTITCATDAVYNPGNEACAADAINVYTSVPEDVEGPGVVELVQISPTSVFIAFDEALDPSSVTGNVLLVTSDGGDDSTVTNVDFFGEGMVIEASAATIGMGSGNTVEVTTSLTDAFGNASAGETVTILPSIKISEIRIASATNTKDEFIELYNVSPNAVNLSGLKLHLWDGTTDTNMPLTFYNTVIQPNGYFLIAPTAFLASNGAVADASYPTSTAQLVSNGSAYISYSASEGTDIIDLVGWGTSIKTEGTGLADITAGQSVERKANLNSNADTMIEVGGTHVFSGNGEDTQNNASDFVVHASSVPQDSFFAPEFSFGADFNSGGDTVAPTVTDSFPSAASVSFVPAQLGSVGIDFSEQMEQSTIDTTSVKVIVDSDPGTNLCQTVTYDQFASFGAAVTCTINPGVLPLTAVPHTLKVTTAVTDLQGNPIAEDYVVGFTPSGSISFGSTAAPVMVGSFPNSNSRSYPPNGNFININFNQSLLAATLAGNVSLKNTTQNTTETITGMSLATVVDTNDAIELDVSGVSFVAGESYLVTVTTGVTSADGIAIPGEVLIPFTVSSSDDNTGPLIIATDPSDGAVGINVGMPVVHLSVDDVLDPSTVTSSTVKLLQGSDVLPATVSYNSNWREIKVTSSMAFDPSTEYKITVEAGASASPVRNVSGIAMQDSDGTSDNLYTTTFTTGSADEDAPSASFASATQNKIDVTFSEGMLPSSVENLSNWSLESPIGSAVPLSAMAGNDVSWDHSTMTATLSGISLTANATFEITAGVGIKDMSGNALGSPTALSGSVLDAGTYGNDIGPGGSFTGDMWDMPAAFSTSEFGFVPQAGVWPMNGMAGATSNYNIDFPISEQIRSAGNGGKVVITFPTGFNVAGATASATKPSNKDANGPGVGTVAVANVTPNTGARTVTVDFSIATRCGSGNTDPCVSGDEHDFISFNISGIVNSSVPRSWETSGYTVDIKTMTNGTLNETMTSMPFFITAAGSNSLAVDITAGSEASGTLVVHISSPSTGEMVQTIDFSGNGTGNEVATFNGLPQEYYSVWTDPLASLGGGTDNYQGIKNEQVWVSGATTTTHTLTSMSGLQEVTINVTGATGKDIDVIANGPNGFRVKRIANTTGSDTVTMKLSDGEWNFDIGPHMDMDGGFMMPEPPDYTVTPRSLFVTVANPNVTEKSGTANDGTIAFALGSAEFTVPVKVVDSSGNPIVDAMISMDDPRSGYGTFGTTSTLGTASLNADAGTYRLMAFLPGAPPTGEVKVKVDSAGNVYKDGSTVAVVGDVTLVLSKGGTVISGTVTDGSNPIAGAGVHAFCTANCQGYFDAGTMSSATGAYTLYVGNGTWKVEAFIPGYGPTGQTTVVVSGSDQVANLEPSSSATFRTISGTVCKKEVVSGLCSGGTPLAGIEIFAHSEAEGGGSNFTKTKSDGTYSLRVPGATGYIIEPFDHRSGSLPIITGIDTSAGNATGQEVMIGTPEAVQINITDSVGSPVEMSDVFIEFFDDVADTRQHVFIKDASSGTINIPEGTYDIFVHSMSAQIDPSTDVVTDNGDSTVISNGVLTVDGSETLKIVVPDLNTVSGQLLDGADPVTDAWIEISDPATGMMMGTSTDSSGNYSINIPEGDYQVNAFSPGLILDAVTLTVDGAETLNLSGSITDQSIAGNITDPNGNPVSYAFVTGRKDGGGIVTTQADADGDYILPVDDGTWTVTGNGYGYEPKILGTPVEISGGSVVSKDVQFTAAKAGLKDPKVTTITPSEGGMANDSSLGLSVTIPSNATSTSSSAGTLTMKETNNVVSTATTDVVGNGFEVSMVDNGGTQLTSGFSEEVSIERTMTVAELSAAGVTTIAQADDLTVSYFSSNGTWIPETTTVTYLDASGDIVANPTTFDDVSDVRFKTGVDHFTVFSITSPSDGVTPSTPTGLTAEGSSSEVVISWNAVTTNSDASAITDLAGYEIYRDTSSGGSFTTQLNGSDILVTSYVDSTGISGVEYFYKVTAADTGGLESTKSSAVSATRTASGGGRGTSSNAVITDTSTDDSGSDGAEDSDETLDNESDDSSDEVVAEEVVEEQEVAEIQDTVTARDLSDVREGIARDSSGRRVARSTGDLGVSPVTGGYERISAVSPGQFIRGYSFNTIYYVDEDLKRRPFWDARSFLTWASDWDDVVWVTDATLSRMPLTAPMLPQPGSVLVKTRYDVRVYMIEYDSENSMADVLRWISSEDQAIELFGPSWSDYVIDIDPTVFVRYTMGSDIDDSVSVDRSRMRTREQISYN